MPLTAGTRLGPYEISGAIGAGGMGEVYKARDTKLARDVAIKTLPDSVVHDPERLARFRREAQLLAALNHPHVAGIYGLEEANGRHFLVLELVDGETLADRLKNGPLPVRDALAMAREIADALDAAHEKGIVHRDLKPGNIALTAHDSVKVLDFGLAKSVIGEAAVDTANPVNSPTITSPMTLTALGVILGTAAYMSPEQARGRAADKRSDVWAFGCVVYEMLTGRRAFEGDDVSDTLAAVLRGEPDWGALPASTPAPVRALLEGCLEKDRRKRIGDMSAAIFVLGPRGSSLGPRASAPARRAIPAWAWSVLLLAAAGVGAAATIGLNRPALPSPEITRFVIPIPEGKQLLPSRRVVTISPDGRRIVYSADGRLHLRSIGDFESFVIATPDIAVQPTFSPDGQSVLFWSEGALKRVSVSGGVPVTVCATAPAPYSLEWGPRGIVFVDPAGGIKRVSPEGGMPETLVRFTAAEGLPQGAHLLPDGDTLIFTLAGANTTTSQFWDKAAIVAQSLKTGQRKVLIDGGSDARYVPTGHLVYLLEGSLMAVPFDPVRLEVLGSAVPVVEGVRRAAAAAGAEAALAISDTGTLVYVPGPVRSGADDIFLYDRKGTTQPLKLPRGSYAFPRVSPDGKWLAFETTQANTVFISLFELAGTSSPRRLTFEGNSYLPVWTADGKRVAFQSDRDGDRAVFWQPVDGGQAERLTKPEPGTSHAPEAWSPRGDVLLFSVTKGTASQLWSYSVADRKAAPFAGVASAAFPTDAAFSPDGRWVAYQEGDLGTGEATTYVQPFPPNGTKFQVLRGGRPQWSRDGKELFFIPAPAQFLAVPVKTDPTFMFGAPVPIVRRFGLAPPGSQRPYDVLPDGRFVAVSSAIEDLAGGSEQIRVVQNWFEELSTRVKAQK